MEIKKKFFLLAGEPSGDLHGSKLIKAIKILEPNSSFIGHGGDLMRAEGMTILEHIDNLSFMGFTEVIKHLPRIIKILKKTKNAIQKLKPDRIILIDYPGFNLQIAKQVSNLSIPITFFILPQVWAWKKNRIKILKENTDQLIGIFPFEKKWFHINDVDIEFLGHPFADDKHIGETSKSFYGRHNLTIEHPILLLLPGSREQEIYRHWPIFLEVANRIKLKFPKMQIILGKPDHIFIDKIPDYIKIEKNAKKAMLVSTAAIVASGTATLECAIENLPMVTCYKMSFISWVIAKSVVKLKYSCMPNIMASKEIVPELLQGQMKSDNIIEHITPLLDINSKKRKRMIKKLEPIRTGLGSPGVYNRVAKTILNRTALNERKN
ncbi:lipid-A-disaccharide synthase [Candidatus Marinimicrobia bacterium]|nr:lipid-A-disaccharide synthase [Candidatus Neomarinimicrobiota bacterium]